MSGVKISMTAWEVGGLITLHKHLGYFEHILVVSVACLLCTCETLQTSRLLNQSVVEKLLPISVSLRKLSYSISGEVGVSLILHICLWRSALVACLW